MKKVITLTVAVILLSLRLAAQEVNEHADHEHHKNDIGIANSALFLVGEDEFAYGLDVHYIRNIKDSDFGLGVGFEKIFGEHDHTTIGIVGSYNILDDWSVNLSPGILFEGDETKFSTHLETAYVFDVSVFHIGPVISVATDFEEAHIGFGIHIGYGF